jgi:hypothetical protein
MAVQAFPYLAMTDGTLTVTFADGLGGASSYAPLRGAWAPAITTRRRAALGRGPWQEVIEEWDLIIKGVDAATALSNLETLVRLLDNADRFWRLGENVSPVLLKYVPQGSTLFTTANPATCLVIGRAPGDETNLGLPATANDVGMLFEIRPVHLRFFRTGQWLNPTAESASSGAPAAIPTVHSATLATALTISSPTKITYDFTAAGVPVTADSSSPSFLLVASGASRLQIYEGEAASLPGTWAITADAANRARGGSVARWPTAGAGSTDLFWTLAGFDSASRRIAVWAAVRNNSAAAGAVYTIRPLVLSALNLPQTSGPLTTIDTSSTNPRMVFLGIMGLQQAAYALEFDITSSGIGSIDIDYVVIHAIDDETSATVALYSSITSVLAAAIPPGYSPAIVDPRALTAPSVLATAGATTLVVSVPYNGDAYIMTKGATVAAVWLGTATAAPNLWRPSGGAATANGAITVARSNGYLSPR